MLKSIRKRYTIIVTNWLILLLSLWELMNAEIAEKLMLLYSETTDIIPQPEDYESYADLDFSTI